MLLSHNFIGKEVTCQKLMMIEHPLAHRTNNLENTFNILKFSNIFHCKVNAMSNTTGTFNLWEPFLYLP